MENFIYLEPDEEISSVIEKIRQSSAGSIGLVAPQNSSLLQSMVNLKLVKNEAEKLKKEITLITQDEIGRNLADQAGIPVYDDVNQDKPTLIPSRPMPASSREIIEVDLSRGQIGESIIPKGLKVHDYRKRKEESFSLEKNGAGKNKKARRPAWQSLVVLIVIVIFIYLFLPKAKVKIFLKSAPFEKQIEIILPAQSFESIKEKSELFPAAGKRNIGEKAKLNLTLFNAWDSGVQIIPAGTTFRASDNHLFKNSVNTSIPGAAVTLSQGQLSTSPGKTNFIVEAIEPGEEYNGKSGRLVISSIAPEKQGKIYAEAVSPSSGGKNIIVSVVESSDLESAKNKLTQELTKSASEEILSKNKKLKITAGSVKIETLEENASAKANEQVSEFTYQLKIKMQAMGFEEQKFQDEVVKALSQQLPADKELIITNSDEVTTNVLESDYKNQKLKMAGLMKTRISEKLDEIKVKKLLRNQSSVEAKIRLLGLPGVNSAEIKMSPKWWPGRLPIWFSRIEIEKELVP